jgi:HEAT repeat protein
MMLVQAVLLTTLLAQPPASATDGPGPDLALLREMLHDKQHPRGQTQAALLLMQSPSPEAERVVREGLSHAEEPEVFQALASAVEMCNDRRFADELIAALSAKKPAVRQAAAEAIAPGADDHLLRRLQQLVEDDRQDLAVRQTALWALGRSGRKVAVEVLVQQLRNEREVLRRTAADALADLTGQNHGNDFDLWETWWQAHRDLGVTRWAELRLAYQTTRARRVENELGRAQAQILRLQQQLYSRLAPAERLAHIQQVLEQDDAAARLLCVQWLLEMLPTVTEEAKQKTLTTLLLRLTFDATLDVQRAAVLSMGRLPLDEDAVARLKALLRRGDASVRAAAARALAQLARSNDPGAAALQKQVVPLLQKALNDPALEVVVEAAEDLGALGAPEAGPVLLGLLQHTSEPVRQTAAQALERVADRSVLDGLLEVKDEASVTVRFSCVGALARAIGDSHDLEEGKLKQVVRRLEAFLQRDPDAGVRSRAATVLGECAPASTLSTLWKCCHSGEDVRVQEKAWAALIEVLVRAESVQLLQEWDSQLAKAKQGTRRMQMLAEVVARWGRRADQQQLAQQAQETQVNAQLELGKWAMALPLIREILTRPGNEVEVARRLRWLLNAGELALQDGQREEAHRIALEAQPHLPRTGPLTEGFEKLLKASAPRE